MANGKFWVAGATTLGLLAISQAAFAAEPIIITPGQAADRTVTYQEAAPTRYFNVEKAITLPEGENRIGANLQVGGLGIGGNTPGVAGGVNLRADWGVSPGLETGLSVTGLGATGVNNLLGNVALRGKMALSEFSIGMMPVEVGGLASVGALGTASGIASANVGVGIPMTATLTNTLNVTVAPGIGFGFNAGGLLPGGTTAQVNAAGFRPALGLGLDWMLTDKLSALVDGNQGYAGGFDATGNLGVRYGFTDDFAADLFVGYQGSPLQAVNAGTVGLGGFYAF